MSKTNKKTSGAKQTKAGKAQDKRVKAHHPGKRTTKDGTVYYEYRKNRADINRTKKL